MSDYNYSQEHTSSLEYSETNLRHSLQWTVFLATAYTLIFVVGVAGNLLVILVFVLKPQMRTVTNMFIINLSVADLFVSVFCIPATLLANVFTSWILTSFLCKWVAYVQGVSVFASAYSLVAISLDRCRALCRPMQRAHGLSKSQSLRLILFIWLASLLITIPWAVVFDTVYFPSDNCTYCVENWDNEQQGQLYFLAVNLICGYILPFFLIFLLNMHIWYTVSHRTPPETSGLCQENVQVVHRKRKRNVRRMISLVTLAFLLSWLPLFVLATLIKFSLLSSDYELDSWILPVAQLIGFSNSSINPILYAFLNSKFRKMFSSVMRSCLHKKLQPDCIKPNYECSYYDRCRGSVAIFVNEGRGPSPYSTVVNTTVKSSTTPTPRNSFAGKRKDMATLKVVWNGMSHTSHSV